MHKQPPAPPSVINGAFLSIRDLQVRYGATPVLDGIGLEVAQGEMVALLGASGCGKTTLLRTLCGFQPAHAGAITVNGRDLTTVPPEKRDMAMVFQSYALWPHMTVAGNIEYGLKLRRLPRPARAAKVREVAGLLGLADLLDRPVDKLSGGQRQRVALGRALAVDPSILLLDEPLSNLDAKIRHQVRHDIRALQQRLGITAILVTHDREEAMIMADRIVVLDRGRIAQVGTPEDLYARPSSPFVASFMGADNAIVLHGEADGGRVRVRGDATLSGATLPAPDGARGPLRLTAHFRAASARLVTGSLPPPADGLLLRGHVTQRGYPGGLFRYAVAVGERAFLVDDPAAYDPGAEVGIHLPAHALHLFPDPSPSATD